MQLAAIGAVAFYLHAICWATVPPDLKLYLFPWYKHILDHGPVAAFAEPFSNYTPRTSTCSQRFRSLTRS
jgi:hypothetical protein